MKKFISIIIIPVLFFIFLPYLSGAQTEAEKMMSSYPIYPDGNTLGQNQYYSVVFDGEGEAAVAIKYTIYNSSEEDINKVILEIPGANIRMINALEEVYGRSEKVCDSWEDTCVKKDDGGVCVKYERNCAIWGYKRIDYNPIYHTLKPQSEKLSNSIKYTFDLAKNIASQESASLILYYKATGYVKKSFGIFNFNFETIKSNFDVNQIRVAVNVQEGFYLKGGKAETQYQQQAPVFSALEMGGEMKGMESQSIRSFSQNIIYQQGYVKQTSGLDPWESFTVNGKYSGSRFLLNFKLLLLVLIVAAGIILGIRILIRKLNKKTEAVSMEERPQEPKKDIFSKILISGGGGGAGSLAVIFGGQYIVELMTSSIGYQYRTILGLLVVLVLGILFLISVFGPAVFIGRKYGLKYGIWTLVVTIITIILLALIITVLLASFKGGGIIEPLIF